MDNNSEYNININKLKRDVLMLNRKDNYLDLLNEIKRQKLDNYKPRKYNFGLKDFDEKGEEKKRESKTLPSTSVLPDSHDK